LLERDFLVRTEFFTDVEQVIAQPVRIPFQLSDGRRFHYTPDFLVYRRLEDRDPVDYPRPELVEVKPEKKWRKHYREWFPKWKAAWRLAQDEGWSFHIHDESRIRDRTLENVKFLKRYGRMNFDYDGNRLLLDTLDAMGSAPVHYLANSVELGENEVTKTARLWHLLATRQIECDIGRELDVSTEIWIDQHDR